MATNHKDKYPNVPGSRAGSPETSAAAARSMIITANNRRGKVFRYIEAAGKHGATADEIEKAFGWERQSSMPRIAELHAPVLVVESGHTRLGASGRRQTAWVLPEYAPKLPPKDHFDWPIGD